LAKEKGGDGHGGEAAHAACVPVGEVAAHAGPAKQVDRTQSRIAATGRCARGGEDLHSALERIRQVACRDKRQRFTSLWHHVYDVVRLDEAYHALRRDAAAGVDGQTWQDYGKDLEANLKDLSVRLARGAYRAKPVKRAYVPKADGQKRPIGIPALEDKIVQRATVSVLNAVWETDFLGFSYGFRPGRSAHVALDALAVGIQTRKVNWVLDADIRAFFDTLDHGWLIKFVEHRIADPRVVRHIQKWLNAGVMREDGQRERQEAGAVQGGSISPLLANVYLHYVLDLWAQRWRRTRARGDVILVRYADDFIVGFQHESDARRFREELAERFRRFNLELHADKTRVIEFGRFAAEDRKRQGDGGDGGGGGKPMTFNFLGFTHACDRTRNGKFIVLRRTMAQRLRAKLQALKEGLRRRLHHPIAEVGGWLASVLRGHYQYYGVPRNYRRLASFRDAVRRLWHRALNRRSQKATTTESRMSTLATRWLPMPRICQPYPMVRLAVIIQGKSPVR
jgi:group II intron reverse transcriptase/maturase